MTSSVRPSVGPRSDHKTISYFSGSFTVPVFKTMLLSLHSWFPVHNFTFFFTLGLTQGKS